MDRAYQRLSQESGEPTATTISTAMQARETLARLRALMQGDAQTALRAHGGIRTDFFEAAIAQPTI